MPPNTQFSRDDVLNIAFEIFRKEGPSAITARRIASELGSSVGPIYTSFENLEDLNRVLAEKASALMEDYSRRPWTEMPFLNMGVGFIFFARDEPVLFRECYLKGIMGDDPLHPDARTIARMREDPLLSGIPEMELSALYVKLSFITFGIAMLASMHQLKDETDGTIIDILFKTGSDLIFMAKARNLLAGQSRKDEGIEALRRYLDGH